MCQHWADIFSSLFCFLCVCVSVSPLYVSDLFITVLTIPFVTVHVALMQSLLSYWCGSAFLSSWVFPYASCETETGMSVTGSDYILIGLSGSF